MASKEKSATVGFLARDIAGLLKNGEALTKKDIILVCEFRGLHPTYVNGLTNVVFKSPRFAQSQGVEVALLRYRKKSIYYDASKDAESETNINEVKRKIDFEYEARRNGNGHQNGFKE